MIEAFLRFMGRFDFSSQKRSRIPYINVNWYFQRMHFDVTNPTLGHSPMQARANLLVIASLIHALFFVIMGTNPQYPSILTAFALVAFARALLTGASFLLVFCSPDVITLCSDQGLCMNSIP